jgi:hypothetical protein
MSRIRIIGLALVAVFAMSAVGAASASASALPAFTTGKCIKVTAGTGWWTNNTCTTESPTKMGEFEWEEPVQKEFTVKSGVTKLKTKNHTIECKTDENGTKHEITGPKHVSVIVVFKECKDVGTGASCGTGGVITTNALKGWLFYIKEAAPKEVGVFFEPEVAGKPFAEFKCSILTVKVTGCASSSITPANKIVKTTEHFTEKFPGPTKLKYEGVEKTCELEAFGEKAEEIGTEEITPKEAIEIKA